MNFKPYTAIFFLLLCYVSYAQNSLTGDGFGGRLWYKPYNYSVGSYSGYTVCGDSFQLYGWGENQYGQLGNGNKINSNIPVKAIGMTQVKFYTCGYVMSVIKCDSTGWAWDRINVIPMQVITGVKFTDAGSHDVSYVKYDGTVWSIGSNQFGQYGTGSKSTSSSLIPEKMKFMSNAVRTANSFYNLNLLTSDRKVFTCGNNVFCGLGIKNLTEALSPVEVSGLTGIVDIKAIDYTIIALDSTGNVFQWGKYVNSFNFDSIPRLVPQLKNIIAISGCDDGDHFLAIDSGGVCFGWGRRSVTYGAGPSLLTGSDTPIVVATNVADILAGESFSYIVKKDGSMWSSGLSLPIWMNLSDSSRGNFVQIDPTDSPMYLCNAAPFRQNIEIHDSFYVCSNDSILFKNKYYKPDTTLIDSIEGGACGIDSLKYTVITNKYHYNYNRVICSGDTVFIGLHKYWQSGEHYDSLQKVNGCDSIIYSKILVLTPTTNIRFDTLCTGDSLVIGNSTLKNTGTYNFNLKNNYGCDSNIICNLNVKNRSFYSQSINICPGDSIRVYKRSYRLSGNYQDTLLNFVGCDSVIYTSLFVYRSDYPPQNRSICESESIKIGVHSYSEAGIYTDTLSSQLGCDSIVTTILTVKKLPLLQLRDTFLCSIDNPTVTLDAGDYKAYTWIPGGASTRTLNITSKGTYVVTVVSFDSCNATDTIIVKDSCARFLLIPNVFTVNNDDLNDAFDIEIKGEIAYDLKIFNRWGELIYQGDTDGKGNDGINWNGTFQNKGKECPEGVYYVLFNYEFPSTGKGSHKGEVTLIRKN